MRRSIRRRLEEKFPNLNKLYRKTYRAARIEYKVLRQIGVRSILRGTLWSRKEWRELLPVQRPQRIEIGGIQFETVDVLVAQLVASNLVYAAGGNAVYLPPATVDATEFRLIRDYYPPDAGLKIVRDPGGIDESNYISGQSRSAFNKKLTSNHGYLSLAANLLFLSELGPRLYDLVELSIGGRTWTAYVVQHVNGREPTMEECKEGLKRIQALEKTGAFQITLPQGYKHKDFACPGCNGNAWTTEDGRFLYVDFQNFVLGSYDVFLSELAERASHDTHFGDESVLWGGRFLYQSVPGLQMPSRRNVDQRVTVIERLMENAGLRLENRLVLDVGCNIGMVMAEYLKKGAQWCHGWDMPPMAYHAEKMLLALGCTRFSLTGGEIRGTQSLEDDLPDFLRPLLTGCVVSYLAIRRHVGWLEALGRIRWSHLIYEDHQGDNFEADMEEFRQVVDFEVAQATRYADGLSGNRNVAILVRQGY